MAKTQEELNQLKNEYETLNNKLNELTEDELKSVTGGINNQYITFYVGPEGCVRGCNIQVGDYFISDEFSFGQGLIVYRLESKDSNSLSSGKATKFTVDKGDFPNYSIDTNISIPLTSGFSRIYKPDWIMD